MEEWIQLILFLIFGAIALFTRMLNRRGSRAEPDVEQGEEEITLPPWGNVPMEEDAPLPDFIEVDEPEATTAPPPEAQVASQSEPLREETPPPPPGSAAPPVIPTVAGIPLTPQTFRQGIILAEILRPPKSLRPPQQ